MALSKFGPKALLLGATLHVPGSTANLSMAENDNTILFVSVSQGAVLRQSRQLAPGSDWTVPIPSDGFVPGPATALGLLVKPVPDSPLGAAPGGYQTFTWGDAIELVTDTLGPDPAPG